MDSGVKYSLVVAVILLILIFLSKGMGNRSSPLSRDMQDKYKKLVEQIDHWYLMAKKDSSILLALIHINAALSKVNTLSTLLDPSDILKYTNVDLPDLKKRILTYHDKVIRGFEEEAPNVALSPGTHVDLDWFV